VRFLFGASPRNIGNGFAFTLGYNVLKSGLVWPVQKNVQDYVKSQNIEGTVVSSCSPPIDALSGVKGGKRPLGVTVLRPSSSPSILLMSLISIGIKGTIISGAVGNVIPGILMNPFNVIKGNHFPALRFRRLALTPF